MNTLDRNSLTLPVEVVIEIFSRLPLKSIARSRCVCKLWSSLLRGQDFTDSFSTKSRARPQLLFACSDHRVSKFIFFTSPQPENPEENSNVVVATNHLAPFPLSDVFYGSTNGFFCYEAERIFEGMEGPVFDPVVCNPNTGQSLTLPSLNSRDRHGAKSYLGYDPIGKEFKVLSTLRTFANDEWIVVKHQVLTLGTDDLAWRSVECCVTHSYSSKWICIGGVIYYATSVDDSSRWISWKLSIEKCTIRQLWWTTVANSVWLCRWILVLLPESVRVLRCGYLSRRRCKAWVVQACVRVATFVEGCGYGGHVHRWNGWWKGNRVFSPLYQHVPSYVVYFNVERKTITKVGILGMEAFQGMRFSTHLNYVENAREAYLSNFQWGKCSFHFVCFFFSNVLWKIQQGDDR